MKELIEQYEIALNFAGKVSDENTTETNEKIKETVNYLNATFVEKIRKQYHKETSDVVNNFISECGNEKIKCFINFVDFNNKEVIKIIKL